MTIRILIRLGRRTLFTEGTRPEMVVASMLVLGLVFVWSCTAQNISYIKDIDALYYDLCPGAIALSLSSGSSCVTGYSTRPSDQPLKAELLKGWFQCWINISQGTTGSSPVLRVLLPDIYEDWLRPTLQRFSDSHGVPVDLSAQPMDRLLDTIINDTLQPPFRQHAVWLQTTLTTQHLADRDISLDLSYLVESPNSGLEWSDVYQLFRLQLASYRGRVVSMPLDGSTMYLINRKDVFTQLKLEAPRTWQDVLRYAEKYTQARSAAVAAGASTVTVAANKSVSLPPYPLCIPRGASCTRLTMLQAVWSTIAQTHGSQQGVHFDPETLQPLLDTPPAMEAFRIMAGLLAVSAPLEPDEGCTHGSLGFARGQCAMVVAVYVPQMRMLIRSQFKPTVSMSQLEVWPVPGSDKVWTRGSLLNGGKDQLVSCNTELCPQATLYRVLGANSSATMLVNHAPHAPGSNLAGAVNRRIPLVAQYIAFELLAYLASPDRYNIDEPSPMLQTVAPVRENFVTTNTVGKWVEAGYDRDVMSAAMNAIAFTRKHPNRAWDLRMPDHMTYNNVLAAILSGLENGTVVLDEILAPGQGSNGMAALAAPSAAKRERHRRLQQQQQQQQVQQQQVQYPSAPPSSSPSRRSLSSALQQGQKDLAAYYVPEEYKEKYLASLAFIAPPSVANPRPPGGPVPGKSAQTKILVLSFVVPTMAVAALGGGGSWVMWWRRRRRSPGSTHEWTERRKQGVGEPVAIVVTDIQDSTTLWEVLPAAVMSEAIHLHHACVRRLLLAHGGYESATEGDSFILAFFSVKQAVAFAMDLQAQLMTQPWPVMLLEQPACRVVFMDLPEGFPFSCRPSCSERNQRYGTGSVGFRSRYGKGVSEDSIFSSSRTRPLSGHHRRSCTLTASTNRAPSLHTRRLASAGVPQWLRTLTMSDRGRSVCSGATAAAATLPEEEALPAGGCDEWSGSSGAGVLHQKSPATEFRMCRTRSDATVMTTAAVGDRKSGYGSTGATNRAISFSSVNSDHQSPPLRQLMPVSLNSIMACRYSHNSWVSGTAEVGPGGSAMRHDNGGGDSVGVGAMCEKATQYGTPFQASLTHLTDDFSCGYGVSVSLGDRLVRQSRVASVCLSLLSPTGKLRDTVASSVDGGVGSCGGHIAPLPPTLMSADGCNNFLSSSGTGTLLLPPPPSPQPLQPKTERLLALRPVSKTRHVIAQDGLDPSEEQVIATASLAVPNIDDTGGVSGKVCEAAFARLSPVTPTLQLTKLCAAHTWPYIAGCVGTTATAAVAAAPVSASKPIAITATAAAGAATPVQQPLYGAVSAPTTCMHQAVLQPPPVSAAGSTMSSTLRPEASRRSFLFCKHVVEQATSNHLQRSTPFWKLPPSQQLNVTTPDEVVGNSAAAHAVELEPHKTVQLSSVQQNQLQQQRNQQHHNELQQQQNQNQRLMPICAPAATASAVTWHELEDTLALPTGLAITSMDTVETVIADGYVETAETVATGDADNRRRGPVHTCPGLGPRTSRIGRQHFAAAFTSLSERKKTPECSTATAAIATTGSYRAAPLPAAGLPSGARSQVHGMGSVGSDDDELSLFEMSQTLGQFLKRAAAARGGLSLQHCSSVAATLDTCPSLVGPSHQMCTAVAAAAPMIHAGASIVGPYKAAAAAAGCIFRGLRVRMGISWTVPSASELQYNTAAARMVYGGPCVASCKALADMAHGGQVLMNGPAKEQLYTECGSAGSGRPNGTMILCLGTYEVPYPATGPQRVGGLLSGAYARQKAAAAAAAVASPPAGAGPAIGGTNPSTFSLSGMASSYCAANNQSDSGMAGLSPPSQMFMLNSGTVETMLPSADESQMHWQCSNTGSASVPGAAAARSMTPAAAVEPRCVYWVTSPRLSPRLAILPPLRVPPEMTPLSVVYDAPVGHVSYVVVQVPAVATLMAWNRSLTEEALRMLQVAAAAQLQRVSVYGTGYKAPPGSPEDRAQICAVFTTAAAAVRWGEGLRRELLSAPWPPELLTHELCEVVEAEGITSDPWVGGPVPSKHRRGRSHNSSFRPDPGADGGDGGAAAAAATSPVASTEGAAAATNHLPSLSSPQQQLWATAPPGNDVSTLARRGGSDVRAASNNFAAFLMLRRQECRSQSRGQSQRSLSATATATATATAATTATATAATVGKLSEVFGQCSAYGKLKEKITAAAGTQVATTTDTIINGAVRRPYQVAISNSRTVRTHQFLAPNVSNLGGSPNPKLSPRGGGGCGCELAYERTTEDSIAADAASFAAAAVNGGVPDFHTCGGYRCPQPCSAYSGCSSAHDISPRELSLRLAAAQRCRIRVATSPRPGDSILQPGDVQPIAASVRKSTTALVPWTEAARMHPSDAPKAPGAETLLFNDITCVDVHRLTSETTDCDYLDIDGSGAGGGVCSEAAVLSLGMDRRSSASSMPNLLPITLLRGLRIRAGIAAGIADWSIQDHTHALTYSGRPVVAAAKLAAAAASGQVLCDEATRNEAMAEQLWALSLEEEAGDTEDDAEQQLLAEKLFSEGDDCGANGAGADNMKRGLLQMAGEKGVGEPRQQLLAFTTVENAGVTARKKGLERAYVCRMFDRGASASIAIGKRTDDTVSRAPMPMTAPQMRQLSIQGSIKPAQNRAGGPLLRRRMFRNRRASTIDGSSIVSGGVMATAATTAAATVAATVAATAAANAIAAAAAATAASSDVGAIAANGADASTAATAAASNDGATAANAAHTAANAVAANVTVATAASGRSGNNMDGISSYGEGGLINNCSRDGGPESALLRSSGAPTGDGCGGGPSGRQGKKL